MSGCVHEMFAARAAVCPDAVAVAADRTLTYAQLNDEADRLAADLRRLAAGPETVVAVALPRSADLVVALLAVLKAGAAYLPLEPDEPARRRDTIVADAGARIVVTDAWLREHRTADPPAVERLPPVPVDPASLAYVVYTSGSTGVPKGVQVQHDTLVNYLTWCATTYLDGSGSGAPLHSPIAYDLSVTTLFAPLLAGRTITVLAPAANAAAALAAALPGARYDFVKLTPAHLAAIAELAGARGLGTRRLVVGGEALTFEALRGVRDPAVTVVNEYGPTETTVACCAYEIPATKDGSGPVPIGTAIAGAELRVLDDDLRPADDGELFVGGRPVARGYLGQPGATAAAFLPDPYAAAPGARMYRTGDLVRRAPDGTLTYAGRIDRQLKVRGHRVDPAEIEAALCGHPGVRAAAVVPDPRGGGRLVGYLVARGEPVALPDDFLADRLPAPMIPAALVWLPELPLTAAGKVDRSALPTPQEPGERAEPGTSTEAVVAEIFGDLLGHPPARLDTDFLALGGDSVGAAQLMARLQRTFRVDVPMDLWHMAPTVTGLARLIDAYVSGGRDAALALHEHPDLGDITLDDEILAALETGGSHG